MAGSENYEDMLLTTEATSLAEALAQQLIDGRVVYHPYGEEAYTAPREWLPRGVATARGGLNLSHSGIETQIAGEVQFCVPRYWYVNSPNLRCFAPWVQCLPRANADWHFKKDSSVCYVLNYEWFDFNARVFDQHGRNAAVTAATEFCLNNARSHLYKYVEAYRNGLTSWRPHWKAWGHGTDGIREYLQWRKVA